MWGIDRTNNQPRIIRVVHRSVIILFIITLTYGSLQLAGVGASELYMDTSRPQSTQLMPLPDNLAEEGTAQEIPAMVTFNDVYPSDNYYAGVEALANRPQPPITGYSDGTFRPNNNATRAQISKILVLSMGWPINTSGGPHFSDVPTGDTFYPYIETAYNRGIISGYGNPQCANAGLPAPCFLPYNVAYRGQFIKMLVLSMGWTWYDPGYASFADVPTTDAFYGYIERAYDSGTIWVYDPNCHSSNCRFFQPYTYIKRGDLCQMIHRAQGTGNGYARSDDTLVSFWGPGIGYRGYWVNGSMRVFYSQFYDSNQGGWLITPNIEDQSELVRDLRYNNPCGITLGVSTELFVNRQYMDTTILLERYGSYVYNPQDVVLGGITNIGRNYIYPRFRAHAVTRADPSVCSGGADITYDLDLP